MEKYSWYNSDSSSSTRNINFADDDVESRENNRKAKPSYHSALHSVRRPLHPKAMTKKPVAPLLPTPPKIYQVESSNFKQVVQKLTSVPKFLPRRLKNMAPPPLNLSPNTTISYSDVNIIQNQRQASPDLRTKFSDHFYDLVTPTLSPASLAWCSFLLQSPGTSTLEQATVL